MVWDIPNSGDNFRVLVLGWFDLRARSLRLLSPCEKRLNQICAMRALIASSSHISRSAAAALKPFTNSVAEVRLKLCIFRRLFFGFSRRNENFKFKYLYVTLFYRNPCSKLCKSLKTKVKRTLNMNPPICDCKYEKEFLIDPVFD